MRAIGRSVAMGVLAAGLALGTARSGVAAPDATAPRTAVVGALVLGEDQVMTVALHPTTAPIELHASTGSRLEVCPGLLNGGVAVPGNSSWPSWTGFVDCLPFADDGSVTLPSTGNDSFHLAFLVRRAESRPTNVRRLEITYVAGDGYFEILPPPIAPGARGPRVSVRPASATSVGAQAYGIAYGDPPKVAVDVRQRDRSVRRTSDPPPGGEAQAYGPVRLGSTVRVTPENRGRRPANVRIAIAWE